ncbi:sel1 repeat family protein [Kaistella flava (ex Peng et al. 2021)]|uniref:Sel1 repeat family protein n=1 Tax=Kaistella flava (ex Peng et al. 2021) TaxID=2038776 RepID=A0A7M2Y8W3_9FLAO|nr:tetratricopeptide repeat protein [Kaistella flava (ex Peng et al. 2021)]QOW09773.1 sel1 repeat family protein [Kaistella flava (ex Peng et al. 2021)]
MPDKEETQNETEKRIINLTDLALYTDTPFESDITDSMLELSHLYENGVAGELEADKEKAHYWTELYTKKKVNNLSERALENDNLLAMLELAELYDNKLAGEKEEDEKEDQANYWRSLYNEKNGDYQLGNRREHEATYAERFPFLAKDAIKGNTESMVKLGLMYRDSIVGQINYWNASDVVELFEKTMAGDVQSMHSLGEMYFYGQNVKEDEVKGYHWLKKAADLDYVPSILQLAELQNSGIEIEKENHTIKELFIKAAQLGSDEAKRCLVVICHEDKNEEEKEKWLQEILQTTDSEVMKAIGYFYYNGDIVEKDHNKAIQWFEKAAENGNFMVMNTLANIYKNGKGNIKKDVEKGEYWNDRHWDFEIDYSEINKFHLPKENFNKAMYWFKRAAAENNVDAIFNVGLLYDNAVNWGGDFMCDESCMFLARKWFKKAISLGHEEAKEGLKYLISDMEDCELI